MVCFLLFFSFCCFFKFAVYTESDSYFSTKQDDTPGPVDPDKQNGDHRQGNDSNLLIVFYVQIMPDDFVMQLHRF
ncbi:hypothetical protein ABF77_08090 [Enterobacter roggenkampii]|uniref:Secreted protein n=1 Tax=Enterobacter roggenkampii TaxID=1812935 RepID=A0A837LKD8_9ENTR|nr:hypothetical protein ABF77_08090 [Enterobacter roggenkampii]